MAIVGVNFYNGPVKLNDTLIVPGADFIIPGLASDTDYPITATNVDEAGNESTPSVVFPASTLQYIPPGAESPVSGPDATMIDSIVVEAMGRSKAPGLALSLTGPRGYYRKPYGLVAAGGRAVTLDDHFRIASGTKSFTATAILMAVDRGELSLDDKLSDFVSGVPNGNLITVKNMMMMRSGVYDYQTNIGFLIAFSVFPTMAYTDEALLLYIQGNAGTFAPGTSYGYTNSNYVLLGLILKAVTGRTPRDIITDDILVPLGLTETKWPTDAVMPLPAGGATNWNPSFFSSAGALTSTVGDMLKWAGELREGTLVSPAMKALRESTFMPVDSGGLPAPLPSTYGYGLGMISTGTWLGHDGTLPGWDCYFGFDTVSGATFVAAENMQTATPDVLSPYSRIFSRIADYLYPGSMAEQDYVGQTVRPTSAVVTVTGGVPFIRVDSPGTVAPTRALVTVTGGIPTVSRTDNKFVTPTGAVVTIIGGTPGASPNVVRPSPATVTVTGGTPTVTVNSFTPFSEENLNRVDRPVPAGATGVWVTLNGGGGGGGSGRRGVASTVRGGGAGGGGGSRIERVFVPVSDLGPTYSVNWGRGGAGGTGGAAATSTAAANGTGGSGGSRSWFQSNSLAINLSAGGGGGGGGGSSTAGGGGGGGGGTGTVTGNGGNGAPLTTTGVPSAVGWAGTNGGTYNTATPNNTSGGAAGGGAGGGYTSGNVAVSPRDGGSTTAASGGARGADSGSGTDGADQAAGVPGPGGGGSGNTGNKTAGHGGLYGGGGAGGGTMGTVSGQNLPGNGADGYVLVEWV